MITAKQLVNDCGQKMRRRIFEELEKLGAGALTEIILTEQFNIPENQMAVFNGSDFVGIATIEILEMGLNIEFKRL